jgi:hypothetical protein
VIWIDAGRGVAAGLSSVLSEESSSQVEVHIARVRWEN